MNGRVERALEPGDVVLRRGDAGYPARLAATADAPPVLFVRGNVEVLELPAIAIVGAREASDAGRARARKLARLLAQRGIAVASGLARGIDTAAHRGALDAGGITFAVIGTPLTRCYPSENAELQRRIGQVGAVVSQFAPSSKTRRTCFPMRNATMSGLTLGTVVIEASENSGSLIQARKALEQGRKLFLPRSIFDDATLSWPLRLASIGAYIFATIEELMDQLGDTAVKLTRGPSMGSCRDCPGTREGMSWAAREMPRLGADGTVTRGGFRTCDLRNAVVRPMICP